MAWWLWTALLLAAAGAWSPPQPLLLHPAPIRRTHRHDDTIHHLHISGWHLELQKNKAIRSPYYTECQFYKGHVLHETDSAVTVTDCEGQLYGLLKVGKEEFVLQPTSTEEGAHVLRRRDVLRQNQPVAYNLTGDTVSDFELDLKEDDLPRWHVRAFHSNKDDTEYIREATPVISRPVSGVKGLWLEMAIIADHTMLKFHGRERGTHYILALMNIVSAIFNDPTLNSNMTLVINQLHLNKEKDNVIKTDNARKSLHAVNKWNYRHIMNLTAGSTGWDAAIWLTRAELGGPSGFAPVGGICSHYRSAAIVRDEGLTSAFVIAHELGHLMGLMHDGEDQCSSEAERGSVMARTVMATLYNFAWSKCSKEQFHAKSQKWWCLHERSADKGVVLDGTKHLPKYTFTMDEQCRSEFGEGFSICKSVKVQTACSWLWCAHRSMPHVCRSKRAPLLEGTPCGTNHWCIDQECQPMPGHGRENTVTVNEKTGVEVPEWEEWSPWSECSATCGYGVRSRRRQCLFKGTISETACEGAASQMVTCWAGICAVTRDVRADACASRNKDLVPRVFHEESKQCKIFCVHYKGGEAMSLGALPDEAPCSYDRPFDVCFQGTCVKGQCNVSDTVCNWCPDGNCSNNTQVKTMLINKDWSRLAVVPPTAHQFSVHIATPIPLRVAFEEHKIGGHILELNKHHTKRFEIEQNTYLKYDPNVPQNLRIIEVDSNVIDIKEGEHFGWEGEAVIAGSLLHWKQTDSDIIITAVSKLNSDVTIMAMPQNTNLKDGSITVEVSVNYSTPTDRTRPMDYRWSMQREPCSGSCGGGVHKKYQPCNTHSCKFVWAPGEWEECSATCGKKGIQERQLFCVRSGVKISTRRGRIKYSVSPVSCSRANKPHRMQPCNRIPCPVYWKEMPWTACSTTCGRGISIRPLKCPAENEMLCGPRPRQKRRRCVVKRCPSTFSKPCPVADETQYCETFTTDELIRYCTLPRFRKYCCNTCSAVKVLKYKGAG